ncbi:MAG: hypothetical protein HY332_07490, partial [Chloroflexi bacterium]|nr:hypothetical protein [Chloroflexota bacterium]
MTAVGQGSLCGPGDVNYPVVWYATTPDLTAVSWSNHRELTLCYDERWPSGLSLAQAPSGAVYASFTRHAWPWANYIWYRTSADEGATWSNATLYGRDAARAGWQDVQAFNSHLTVGNDGAVRAFWDMRAGDSAVTGGTDGYPTQLFWCVLSSCTVTGISPVKDVLSQLGADVPTTGFAADPVNTNTGHFTQPETDIAIPGRGLGLVFTRTYNAADLSDGPLGFGWTHSYAARLTADSRGNVMVADGSGRRDVYLPAAGGGYTAPPGRFTTLARNADNTWTLTEKTQVKYRFSPPGRLTSIADRNNNTVALTYDAAGLLTTVTDPTGRSLALAYTGQRLTSITDPLNRTIGFSYSAAGDLTAVVDARGKTWTYTYDAAHRLLTRVDPNTRTIMSNTYGTHGRVVSQRDAKNEETRFTYSAGGGRSDVTDPRGNRTEYYYDVQYRTTGVRPPLTGGGLHYEYDASNNLTRIIDQRKNGWSRPEYTSFTYDGRGSVLTRKNHNDKIWSYTYDALNNVLTESDPLNYTTTFAYDANNNLLSVTDGRGQVTTHAYDDANNRISTTDPNLKVTSFAYDEKNRLISVTDAANGVTTYAYDGADNRTSVTDANLHARTWAYDAANRVSSDTDALNNVTRDEYDGVGNRTKRTDASGAVTTYAYDALNRVTSVSYAGGSIAYAYDDADRRTSMTDGTGTTTYAYDALDRYSAVTFPGSRTVSCLYDAGGNRTRVTYPDAKEVTYAYDDANRLIAVTDWLNRETAYAYDDAGRHVSTTYPTGVVEARAYTDADQLTSLAATKAGNTLTSFAYTLDSAGLRTAVQRPNGTESYTYDNLYRLTGVTYPDGTTQSYTYDAVGNRLTKVQGGVTTSYTYDHADRLTAAGSATYAYDANGNQTSRTASGAPLTYQYDGLHRLTSVLDQAPPPCSPAPVRINAGGGAYTGSTGLPWSADTGFTGGSTYANGNAIANTTDPTLYQSERYGTVSYAFNLPNGTYTVTLKFAEIFHVSAGACSTWRSRGRPCSRTSTCSR